MTWHEKFTLLHIAKRYHCSLEGNWRLRLWDELWLTMKCCVSLLFNIKGNPDEEDWVTVGFLGAPAYRSGNYINGPYYEWEELITPRYGWGVDVIEVST